MVYLIFNEGYAAHAGDALVRHELCAEALRLGEMLAEVMPRESEVLGLVALMELQASRAPARATADGSLVLLADQDRARWDRRLIARGLGHLARAEGRESAGPDLPVSPQDAGPYRLQAAIAPSPVVDLNRAVAIGLAAGPQAGLDAIAAIDASALRGYHHLPAARADFLRRLGRRAEAAREYQLALALADNAPEKSFLASRIAQCDAGNDP